MNSYFARLTSLERRFLVGVVVIVFLVLNLLFVWPRFGDWSDAKKRLETARQTLAAFQAEIQQKTSYQAQVTSMENEGERVLPEDQTIEFLRTINAQALQSGVSILGTARQTGQTNQFFLVQAQTITVQSGEKQLVDFLYNLSSRSSMIRVRALSVHPDPPRLQLSANITLVASYQKKSAPRAAAPTAAAAPPATPSKPAPTTTNATAAKSATPPKSAAPTNSATPSKSGAAKANATSAKSAAPTNSAPTKSATPPKSAPPTEKRP